MKDGNEMLHVFFNWRYPHHRDGSYVDIAWDRNGVPVDYLLDVKADLFLAINHQLTDILRENKCNPRWWYSEGEE